MDIKCVVCGEPWDSYGVQSDMLPWETKLFRQGAGCPCCKGVGSVELTSIHDFSNGDGDEFERIAAYENRGKVPWVRPDDKVHWECAGCGVKVITDSDDEELKYDSPINSRGQKWYISHRYETGCPEEEPAHVFGHDKMCEFCVTSCAGCGVKVTSLLDFGDVYDPGYCAPLSGESHQNVYCIDCIEKSCSECSCLECSCEDENEDEEDEE